MSIDDVAVVYINCLGATEKRSRMESQFAKHRIRATRKICVDARQMDVGALQDLVSRGNLSPDSSMTVVEVAIAMSHVEALRNFAAAETQKQFVLVFEDDVTLQPGFVPHLSNILDKIARNDHNFSALYIHDANFMFNNFTTNRTKVPQVLDLYQIRTPILAGGAAYLYSRPFCKTLLDHMMPLKYPVDLTSQVLYSHVGNQYCIRPHITHTPQGPAASNYLVSAPIPTCEGSSRGISSRKNKTHQCAVCKTCILSTATFSLYRFLKYADKMYVANDPYGRELFQISVTHNVCL